jgi:catechol 2,3-dioxygenase-like lactoylglutathione lyase family enzyme
MTEMISWSAMVPELACSDLSTSRHFYIELLGFVELYARDGFVYLQRGKLQIMLEQAGGHWATDALERPFGRGINLQMEVPDAAAMAEWLIEAGIILYRPLQLSWYRAGDIEHGQQEFLVQDPDGYLLRFVTPFGKRAAQ